MCARSDERLTGIPSCGSIINRTAVPPSTTRKDNTMTTKTSNRLAAGLLMATSAFIGAAFYYAAPAHADTGTDATFVAVMASKGISSTNGPAGLIAAGHKVCVDLDMVAPANNLAAGVAESRAVAAVSGMSLDNAYTFVAGAVVILCPWNAPLTSAPSGGTSGTGTIA